MIEQFDFFARIISVGASLMLLALVVEGQIRRNLKITLVGLLISTMGYVINSTPALEPAGWADDILNLVAMSAPFWSWVFGRFLFERDPRPRIIALAAGALLVTWLTGTFIEALDPAPFYINRAISLILIADLIRVAFVDRADDLIEKRRVIRLVLPTLIGVQIGLILVYEMILGPLSRVELVQFANGILILLITLFAGIALARTDRELLLESEPAVIDTERDSVDFSPSETVLHTKLSEAMTEGAYRERGITIARLAAQLDTPEHRLRALINQRLGYRNFSAFLNQYRIAEAQQMLSASDHVDLPVLTIAMDLGYNSLSPFNRAFRSITGSSPSEFRKAAFADEPIA
ncbi:helix-turn-helix domain-containing protein [uncultured Erythrobacter sp.]|uniref:AraC family transcriptional regulator n=1 Tax=uncultured Erythrobacter sp. TaxID=263913 RepID=UPI002637FA4D|nr:helix-turn-helix domain-containing protein [uncultured Erythrobacter sp.]